MADSDPATKKDLLDFKARIGAKLDAKMGSRTDGLDGIRDIFAEFVRVVNTEFRRGLDRLQTGIPTERSSSAETVGGTVRIHAL